MKLLIVLALVGLAVARPDDIFDEATFNEALANKRLLGGYFDCFSGNGPCTSEGKKINEVLPGAINTSCADCSETDKVRAAKALLAAQKNLLEKYEALVRKYDPEGKRADELEQFTKQYGS